MQGLDYSAGPPDPAKLAGYDPIVRYVTRSNRPGKRLTPSERDGLRAAGHEIVLVFEDGAQNALGGHAQGVLDGQEAAAQARALGYAGDTIYAAVDFEVTEQQLPTVMAYLDGFGEGLAAAYWSGGYGSLLVVKAALDGGHVKRAWQTRAWSGTPPRIDRRCALYQNARTVQIDGVTCDLNDVFHPDQTGGWPAEQEVDMQLNDTFNVSWKTSGKATVAEALSDAASGGLAVQRLVGMVAALQETIRSLTEAIGHTGTTGAPATLPADLDARMEAAAEAAIRKLAAETAGRAS